MNDIPLPLLSLVAMISVVRSVSTWIVAIESRHEIKLQRNCAMKDQPLRHLLLSINSFILPI